MKHRRRRTLTELELEVMQVIWDGSEVTVEDIVEAFKKTAKPLAPPSIRTMLTILQEKGYVTRKLVGRAHVYRALISAGEAQKKMLTDMIQRAFDGSVLNMVAALVRTDAVSARELAKMRELIKRRQKEGRK